MKGKLISGVLLGGMAVSVHAQTYTSTETVVYHDNTAKWVLGQAEERRVNDILVSSTTFDATYAVPLTVSSFGQVQQTFTYDFTSALDSGQRGTLRTVKDARENVTGLTGWKRGIPTTISYANGTSSSAEVDDFGMIRAVTNERGTITRYDYDPMGRTKLIDYPDGDSVDWTNTVQEFSQINVEEYGIAAGHWRQTVTTGNARKIIYFDGLWRPLIEREEDLSNPATVRVSAKRYDHEGRVTDAYYPQNSTFTSHAQFAKGVHTTYDALGRVTQVAQDAEGGQVLRTMTGYLPGFETLVTDPRQKQTRTQYAALDQPTYDYPVKQFLPEGVEVTIERDAFFKPIELTRSGPDVTAVERFYVYDQQQRLCRLFEPESGSTVTAYDAAGNVSWTASGQSVWGDGCGDDQVAASNRIAHHYDSRNRLVVKDYPAGTDDITLGYEPTGEVRLARLGNHTEWLYDRNKRGLVTQENLKFDGETQALDYVYTPLASLSREKYPSGRWVDYSPNALGQPTQAGSYVTNVVYSPDGDAQSFRYGNGIAFSRSKNDRRLPSNLTYGAPGGGLLYSQDLSYDANANLSQVTDLAGMSPSRSKTMLYDDLNRLTSASAPGLWGTESYKYDSLDNLRERTKDGMAYTLTYDPLNRLMDVKVGGNVLSSYWYDLRGNTTCRNKDGCIGGDTLSYDVANRLQAYGGKQANQYDAWGRRTRKTSLLGGAETVSMYSQGGQLIREHDSAANSVNEYVYLGQAMVAKVSDTLASLTGPSLSGGGHTLTWQASPTAVRYIVEESSDYGAWTQVYSGTDLSWAAGGRGQGTHRYRIKACTADGVCRTHTSLIAVKVGPNIVPILYELLLN